MREFSQSTDPHGTSVLVSVFKPNHWVLAFNIHPVGLEVISRVIADVSFKCNSFAAVSHSLLLEITERPFEPHVSELTILYLPVYVINGN